CWPVPWGHRRCGPPALSGEGGQTPPRGRTDQPTLTVFRKRWRRVVQRGRMKPIVVTEIQCAELGLAKARRVRQHGIKDRLQFSGRTSEDTQHLGRRRLLLKRFSQLVEQSGILDGDDGLRGEILDQIDLLIVEGSDLLAIDSDRTNQVVFLK